jgi:CTP:molybdopterin cytidylyltransferase MocA
MRISTVILAAGNSSRFGANKLLVPLYGKPMYQYAIEKVEQSSFYSRFIVTQYKEIMEKAGQGTVIPVRNRYPEKGMSYSIRLGTESCLESDGILFLVADQPFLSKNTIEKLKEIFSKNPSNIICARTKKHRGNPAVFPKVFYPELLHLTGEEGGRKILEKYPEHIIYFDVENQMELEDIDTEENYRLLGTNGCTSKV